MTFGPLGEVRCRSFGGRDDDLFSCPQDVLEGAPTGHGAGTIPRGDPAGQDPLNGASVEAAHDGTRTLVFLSLQRKQKCWLAFLASDVVLVVQERPSVTCTPKHMSIRTGPQQGKKVAWSDE